MMKKNLFLLFSFYFFVIQSLIIGLLWKETNFFWLAFVNFVFILLIAVFSSNNSKSMDGNGTDSSYKDGLKPKVKVQRTTSRLIPHVWFFVISLLFGFFVWFWLGNLAFYFQLLISVAASYLLFIIFALLFKHKVLKVRESKIYIVVLIALLVWTFINIFNVDFSFVSDLFSKSNTSGSIEQEYTELNVSGILLTGEISSFVSVDDDIVETGDINVVVDVDVDLDQKATFEDVIKYLIDSNNVKLDEKKNIKFTYISYNDEDYPYYKTAYDKKMVGKSVNPDKNLLCETYIVMKGLILGWDVGYYTNIKKAYWDYASSHNELSDCEYGSYVKLYNLY